MAWDCQYQANGAQFLISNSFARLSRQSDFR